MTQGSNSNIQVWWCVFWFQPRNFSVNGYMI